MGKRGHDLRTAWEATFAQYKKSSPALADQVMRMQHRQLPEGWDKNLPVFPADPKGLASRDSSAKVLNVIAQNVPWLIGGSADLAPSTKTHLSFEGAGDFEADNYAGHNFHFGIREHAMCSILNGLSLARSVLTVRVPDLQRLFAAAHAAGGDHGNSCHLCIHSRLYWRG